ncbi:MAG: CoA-binding protein [Dehalococcoidales bacterium]|nr:CoA-binding protein [Dehalococcoidales bacterium]
MNQPKALDLEFLFHPQSIAVVGVSTQQDKAAGGRWLLNSLLTIKYPGRLYPVGSEAGEYAGLKIYSSLRDIPDRLDHIIVAIPAAATLQLARDAAAKGAKSMHLFTAGFSELGGEAEVRMEKELVEFMRANGMRLLGPNCMGIYRPASRMAFLENISPTPGNFGLLSQSGGNGMKAISLGPRRGLFFSKAVSYGNAADINEIDLLEYFADDPETKVIGVYIEGTRDGRRFAAALQKAAQKPLIVYKGGKTEVGRNATLSHTGSLAGAGPVWSGLIKQAGGIEVNDMDEMIDLALLFTHRVPSQRMNTAIIGLGGGAGVLMADTWGRAGLNVPLFSPEVRGRLQQIYGSEAGRSFRNPIDVVPFDRRNILNQTLEAITGGSEIDCVLLHLALVFAPETIREFIRNHMATLVELPQSVRRRILVLLHEIVTEDDRHLATEVEESCHRAGIPIFYSASGTALALTRYLQYHQNHKSGDCR